MSLVPYIFLYGCTSDSIRSPRLESGKELVVPKGLSPLQMRKQLNLPGLHIQRSVYFKLNESTIDGQNSLVLASNVRYLNQNPELSIELVAYADDKSTAEENGALAKARAMQVKRELENIGLLAQRILVVSGTALVLAPNERSYLGNRRVDLVYIRQTVQKR